MANFKDIIGQEQIKEHLQMALSSGKFPMRISSTVKGLREKNLSPRFCHGAAV